MLILKGSTSEKIQLITASAGSIRPSYDRIKLNGSTYTPDSAPPAAITTAATTDIIVGVASEFHNIQHLSFFNDHASVSNLITVQRTDGTNTSPLWKGTLLPGECVIRDEIGNWHHYDSKGTEYEMNTTSALRVARLAADVSNSTTTAAKITGLDMPLEAGTYQFRYTIIYQAGATTTGVKFSVNHTGTVTSFVYWWYGVDNTATAATAAADQDALAATGQVFFAFAARAKGTTAAVGPSISVDTINADMLAIIEGTCVVTAAGNLELYHASEVAAASTVKAGTSLSVIKVA